MELPIYQVDAFASQVFQGNPAAVCPLQEWLPDATLQAIAMENNLSETAFLVGGRGSYEIRWFTPTVEARLCGHATLASAHVVFHFLEKSLSEVKFQSRQSGMLGVAREGDLLELDFPAYSSKRVQCPDYLKATLGFEPLEVWENVNGHRFALLESARSVRELKPALAPLEASGHSLCVTAPGAGEECDYAYRYFGPAQGIPEDPVTGSANCSLAPFWAERLGRREFLARQLSRRGGELRVRLAGDRVKIAGRTVLYLEGRILV
jgi:PhzF family phenazine biosynthesis protein